MFGFAKVSFLITAFLLQDSRVFCMPDILKRRIWQGGEISRTCWH